MFSRLTLLFRKETAALGAAAALIGVLIDFLGFFDGLFLPVSPVGSAPATLQVDIIIPPNEPNLSVEDYILIRREIREDLLEEFNLTEGAEERIRLIARIDELNAQLNHPQSALVKERARLADIERRLILEGSVLRPEALQPAIDALRTGDTDQAEAIFVQVSELSKVAVQSAARAEFGLGEIEESRVNWIAAADRFSRAAELHPTYEYLEKAGNLLFNIGRYEDARETYRKLVDLSAEEYGTRSSEYASALNNYAVSLHFLGNSGDSNRLFINVMNLYSEAVRVGVLTLPDDDPALAERRSNLARVLFQLGEFFEAEQLFRKALDVRRNVHRDRGVEVAQSYSELANLLAVTGRYEEAKDNFQLALGKARAELGESHITIGTWLYDFASSLTNAGEYDEAIKLFNQSITIARSELGSNSIVVNYRRSALVRCFHDAGRLSEAEAEYRGLIEALRSAHFGQQTWLATVLNDYAILLQETDRGAEASPLYLEALEIYRASLGDEDLDTKSVARNTLINLRTHAPFHHDRPTLEAVFGVPD